MTRTKNNRQRKLAAFTLIELLVVISIISLLSSVVLSSLSGARASARDTRRVQDMQQVLTALEIYRNQNGYLPGWGGSCDDSDLGAGTGLNGGAKFTETGNCLIQEIATVMTSVPVDPLADGTEFYYSYDPKHAVDSNRCDGEYSVVIGFNTSETSMDDRQTTTGADQGLDEAAYNRVICVD